MAKIKKFVGFIPRPTFDLIRNRQNGNFIAKSERKRNLGAKKQKVHFSAPFLPHRIS
jgi:hypothetical protein